MKSIIFVIKIALLIVLTGTGCQQSSKECIEGALTSIPEQTYKIIEVKSIEINNFKFKVGAVCFYPREQAELYPFWEIAVYIAIKNNLIAIDFFIEREHTIKKTPSKFTWSNIDRQKYSYEGTIDARSHGIN